MDGSTWGKPRELLLQGAEPSVENLKTIRLIRSSLKKNSPKTIAPLTTIAQDADINRIDNTGCTTHVLTVDAPLENIEPTVNGLSVKIPYGLWIR